MPCELREVAAGEVLAGGQAAGEVDDGRALDHGVVHVEECGGCQIERNRVSALGVERDGGVGTGLAGDVGADLRVGRPERVAQATLALLVCGRVDGVDHVLVGNVRNRQIDRLRGLVGFTDDRCLGTPVAHHAHLHARALAQP